MRAPATRPVLLALTALTALAILVGSGLADGAAVPGARGPAVVDGSAHAPHPWLVPVSPAPSAGPALYTTHYWAGAYYSGSSGTSTQLSTTVTIPTAVPSSSEFYYVLLSAWDSAGSYDQVGFTNDYGHWGFTYSYTTSCAGTYYYNPSYVTLTRGWTYTFTMNLSGTGNLTFAAKHAGSYVVSYTAASGGKHFLDQGTYSCNSASYYDLTDYEEAYAVVQPMPSFDYFFKSNAASNASVTAWASLGAPPGGGKIAFHGAEVEIENEAFTIAFAPSTPHSVKLAKGTTSYTTHLVLAKEFAGTNVTLSLTGVGSIFSASFSPSQGAPGFSDTVTIGISSPSPGAQYTLDLRATDASGDFSYVSLQIVVA